MTEREKAVALLRRLAVKETREIERGINVDLCLGAEAALTEAADALERGDHCEVNAGDASHKTFKSFVNGLLLGMLLMTLAWTIGLAIRGDLWS